MQHAPRSLHNGVFAPICVCVCVNLNFDSNSNQHLTWRGTDWNTLNQRVEIGAVTSWWLRGNEIKKELPRLNWALGYSVRVKPICFDIFYDFIDNKKWSMRLFPLTCIRREKSKVLWESSGLQLSDPCSQHGALKAAEALLVMSHCLV